MGPLGLYQELKRCGYSEIIDISETEMGAKGFMEFQLDPLVKAVVLGITKNFDHAKLAVMSMYLQQPEVKFFVTNEDRVYSAG